MVTTREYLADPVTNAGQGARIDLTDRAIQEGFDLRSVLVELYWDPKKNPAGAKDDPEKSFDLDGIATAFAAQGQPFDARWFITSENPASPGRELMHLGRGHVDQRPNETFVVCLSRLPGDVDSVQIGMFIFLAAKRHQALGQLNRAFARVRMEGSTKPPIQIELDGESSYDAGLTLVTFYRRAGHWKLSALKRGYRAGLKDFVDEYQLKL